MLPEAEDESAARGGDSDVSDVPIVDETESGIDQGAIVGGRHRVEQRGGRERVLLASSVFSKEGRLEGNVASVIPQDVRV